MFSRLSKSTARTLGLSSRLLPHSSQDHDDDDEEEDNDLVMQLEILIHPLQGFLTPWYNLARSLAPVYQNLQHIFIHDVDRVARLLLDLEPVSEYDYMYIHYDDDNEGGSAENQMSSSFPENMDHLTVSSPSSKHFPNSERELPPRKQRNSTFLTQSIVIPSTHPSAPTIVITPSPSECDWDCTHSVTEASFSSRVPIQDSAFRSRLTVPRHPTFNCVFPPMRMVLSMSMSSKPSSSEKTTFNTSTSKSSISTPSSCSSSESSLSCTPVSMIIPPPPNLHPLVESWRWKDGHWQAVLPGLEEQMRKGVFSRIVPMHVLMHFKSGHGRRAKGRSSKSLGSRTLSTR